MKKIKAWIAAARLRTLPLSVSGIIVGSSLAIPSFYSTSFFWMAIFVTLGFQVVSNFANDYGDGVKGTDAQRQGERRMVASGAISAKHMKIGIWVAAIATFLVASNLIFQAFGMDQLFISFIFFNLTLLSLVAAVTYTVGKKAYGYSGWGDLFVFLFFGLLSVLGSNFLYTKSIDPWLLLPAISVGFFSTAVLNLNNLRDRIQDAQVGKKTLVVLIGTSKAKVYHFVLLIGGMVAALIFTMKTAPSPLNFLYVVAFIPFLANLVTVWKNKEPRMLDGELKKVALGTFFFSLLMAFFH